MNTLDIFGARANSLKRGIQTKRSKNPLDFTYQLPGHSELVEKNPFSMTKKEAELFAKTSLAKSGLHLMKGDVEAKVSPKNVSFAQKLDSFI